MFTWLFAALAFGGGIGCYLLTKGQRRLLAAAPAALFIIGFFTPLPLDAAGVDRGTVLIVTLLVQGGAGVCGLWALWVGRQAASSPPPEEVA